VLEEMGHVILEVEVEEGAKNKKRTGQSAAAYGHPWCFLLVGMQSVVVCPIARQGNAMVCSALFVLLVAIVLLFCAKAQ
jgi:uncharacterized Zn-finger protein